MEQKFYRNSDDVRKLLKDNGLTQRKFEEKTGISRATLNHWLKIGGVTKGNWLKVVSLLSQDGSVALSSHEVVKRYKDLSDRIKLLEIQLSALKFEREKIYDEWGHRIGGLTSFE